MADLSAETQAIIKRLKDEGELVRNSGTNSIRSVKIELSKFKGVFDVISANIVEQTGILRQQAGFAADALEAQRSKEQFEEIQKESADRNSYNANDDAERKRKNDENIDKMSESIANAFSLKNLALAGAGLFVGYNIIKGFIDEQTGGGFTAMESKLGEFANFDLNAIKLQFDQLTTDISAMGTSLASISTSLATIVETFDKIANMGLLEIVSGILLASTGLRTAIAGLGYIFRRMTIDLNNGTKPRGGVSWWRRALGLGPDTATPPKPGAPGVVTDTPESKQRPTRPGQQTSGSQPIPGGSRGSYGSTPESRAQIRRDAAASRPGRFRLDSQGRLQRPGGGGFASDAEALDALQKSLDPKYSKVFGRLIKLFSIIKIAFAVYLAYEIYSILSDTSLSDDEKMQRMAPILGSLLGGLGGAAIGAAIGSIPPGTGWGTLLLGIVGGIAGSLAGEQLGYYVAKWAFSEEPTEEERRAIRALEEETYARTNEFAGYTDPLSFDVTPSPSSTPTQVGPQNVKPRPAAQGRINAQDLWDREYGATHNADGTPRGGRGSIVERPGDRAAYQSMVDSLVESENAAQRRIDEISRAGSSAPVIVINSPTTVSPVVNNVSGGKSINQVSIRGGGGGGGMFGSSNPYGLPSAAN